MANTVWCYNAKTGEIFSYQESGGLTDFPRGTFLAYLDYLTTGIESKAAAIEWAKQYGECATCKEARPINDKGKCRFCGGDVLFHPLQVD